MLLNIGDIVEGRYELIEELGRGGFGCVYRARQVEIGREVAIKVLYPPGNPDELEQVRARFRREAMMVANLNHPHTIRQYDFGETTGGVMYFVMEYLRGQTLDQALESEGPMNDARVAHIARGVLKSLSEAHAQGIVHRDLKPGNIMLCEIYGETDFVKVLDFGIAKTTMGNHDITSAGMTLGSPAYMAPELLRGDQPVPGSDLYALGLTLVESLIAEPLIKGDNMMQCARVQLSPAPIPVPPAVQKSALWPWMSKALEKESTRRYPSALAMLNALEELERTSPVQNEDPMTMRLDSVRIEDIPTQPPLVTLNAPDIASTQPLPAASGHEARASIEVNQPTERLEKVIKAALPTQTWQDNPEDDDFSENNRTAMMSTEELFGSLPGLGQGSKPGLSSPGPNHTPTAPSPVSASDTQSRFGLSAGPPAHAVNFPPASGERPSHTPVHLPTSEMSAPRMPARNTDTTQSFAPPSIEKKGKKAEDEDEQLRLLKMSGIIAACLLVFLLLIKFAL